MRRIRRVAMAAAVSALAVAGVALIAPTPAQASSPGRAGAFVVVRSGDVYKVAKPGGAAKRLTRFGDVRRPRWSPDGQRIAFVRSGDVWTMKSDGTGAKRIAGGVHAGGVSWSPDGAWLAYMGPNGTDPWPQLWKVRSATPAGKPVLIDLGAGAKAALARKRAPLAKQRTVAMLKSAPSTVAELGKDTSVAWSPDGTKIAFPGGDCIGIFDNCLAVVYLANGAQSTVAGFGGGGQNSGFAVLPSWTPDGKRLMYTSYERAGQQPGVPVHVTECVIDGTCTTVGQSGDREGNPSPVAGADGVLASRYTKGVVHAVLVSRSGRSVREVTAGGQPDWQPRQR